MHPSCDSNPICRCALVPLGLILFCASPRMPVQAQTSPGTEQIPPASAAEIAKKIDQVMAMLYAQDQFNGSVLVAVRGEVIYSKAFGPADFRTKEPFTPATISFLASVSKQFTSMAIMMLAEQGRLRYDDPLSKYFPELPDCYGPVLLRHLLTMTSGIVDYPALGADHPGMTNQEVVEALVKQKSLSFPPGENYDYCNANYVLLSLIVEKNTGRSFRDFLQEKIFDPLDMKSTFVYADPSQKTKDVAIGFTEFGKLDDYIDHITGSSGLYSNLEDLFKWDQALGTEVLVKQSTLAQAYVPGSVRTGTTTYGFGWNFTENEHGKNVWHTGNSGGLRAYIHRGLTEQTTVIMLTNKGQSERIKITDAIINILAGKPYTLPKIPVSRKMYAMINNEGFRQAIEFYKSVKEKPDTGGYDLAASELRALGYELLKDKKAKEAVEVFQAMTDANPGSADAFISLGRAHSANGDKEGAVSSVRKALEINPNNKDATSMLKKLGD